MGKEGCWEDYKLGVASTNDCCLPTFRSAFSLVSRTLGLLRGDSLLGLKHIDRQTLNLVHICMATLPVSCAAAL